MRLEDNPKFKEYLNTMGASKQRIDEIQRELEEKKMAKDRAMKAIKKMREEYIKTLQEEKEKLMEERDALISEYYDELPSLFCNKNGKHTNTYRSERTINEPLYHTYTGYVYPTETFHTCLICGYGNDPKIKNRSYYQKGSEEVIKKAAEQGENMELQKVAKRILEIKKEIEDVKKKLHENEKSFDEICILFGHDILQWASDTSFQGGVCRCCKKYIFREEYKEAGINAKCKGIVYFENPDSHISIR